ncbi:N-acetylglucosamine 6-phosphate deacetylase [Melghirimyces profundicolus]|uniref:N-acetylglucosamine-6-phosphate deacetylase n=1 Tax=Melghirimyces profundicolus TaxID=1242148 RepID=A0A2T6BQX9_9BACL|nr:N-acetylglucosamine-6-phosphate deacetylase [Melghirimyces profundicolus]PTX58493.1 N-acetylglucosamine 6-phosphate deacetylase [Melghirimyces profundicolus]
MDSVVFRGATVYGPDQTIPNGELRIRGGRIESVGPQRDRSGSNKVVELPPTYSILPGMIDMHIHGTSGADTMDGTPEALQRITSALPREGTTAFLATTITQSESSIDEALINIARWRQAPEQEGAEILGVHLEGPFLSHKRAGAQPLDAILPPSLERFQRWQNLSNDSIRLVTLAPELPGALELIQYLKKTGVVASIGHSDATYDETVQGFQSGVTHATHLFNGMRGLHHREPGVVGAVLLHPEVYAELIVDGFHSRPEMIRLAFQCKSERRLVLITDAMRAKCMPEGTYELGGQEVRVQDGQALLPNGTLAGSILRMCDAVQNMLQYTDCTLRHIIAMTAENPSRELGVDHRKGSLAPGKDADFIVLDENLELVMTYCRGKQSYHREEG